MNKEIQDAVRIPLRNLRNTRDLGGYLSTDGRQIRPRRLIRSGALFGAAAEDLELLQAGYGLKTVVDFRTSSEKNSKPDPELPEVVYVENPILEGEALGITREGEERLDGNELVKKVVSAVHTSGTTPVAYMNNLYKKLITNPFSRTQYRKFFDILLKQEEGAVLWHCTAGKDRVGVGTILLLSALSIPREQIIADYLKVNEFNKEKADSLMDALRGQTEESLAEKREAVRLLFMVDRAYAEAVFEAMEQESGSVDAFLEKEMGLTEEKRCLLKNKYLE